MPELTVNGNAQSAQVRAFGKANDHVVGSAWLVTAFVTGFEVRDKPVDLTMGS